MDTWREQRGRQTEMINTIYKLNSVSQLYYFHVTFHLFFFNVSAVKRWLQTSCDIRCENWLLPSLEFVLHERDRSLAASEVDYVREYFVAGAAQPERQ